MTNLLANPDNWIGVGGDPSFDGDSYQLANGGGGTNVFSIRLAPGVVPSPGDTLAGQVSTTYTANPLYLKLLDASNRVLQSMLLTTAPQVFNWDMTGAMASARLHLSASSASPADSTFAGQTLTITPDEETNYNCACDEDGPIVTDTLANLRRRMLIRLGFSAQASTPPPGMVYLLDDFLRSAQVLLYNRYPATRSRRMFTWELRAGVRFYDLEANRGLCTLKLDGRRIAWAGVSQGDDVWTPIVCGIPPEAYTTRSSGIVQWYEVRQCIEVWPPPSDDAWLLRIKGDVGLLPLVADTDRTTVDAEGVFLLALANAKAHYNKPDARDTGAQAQGFMRDLTAASHGTRRYIPGETQLPHNRPFPRRV
jgi:hypothetical protein